MQMTMLTKSTKLTKDEQEFLRGFALAAKRVKGAPEGFVLFHLTSLRTVKGAALEGAAKGLEAGLLSAVGVL